MFFGDTGWHGRIHVRPDKGGAGMGLELHRLILDIFKKHEEKEAQDELDLLQERINDGAEARKVFNLVEPMLMDGYTSVVMGCVRNAGDADALIANAGKALAFYQIHATLTQRMDLGVSSKAEMDEILGDGSSVKGHPDLTEA